MAFTYDSTISTDLAKVRLRIGDVVDRGEKSLTDAEINYVLGEESNLDQAAVRCLEYLIAKLRRYYDRDQSGISESQSQEFDQLNEMLILLRRRAKVGGSYTVYDGSCSETRKEAGESDTDYIKPFARIGMDDYYNPTDHEDDD